MYGCQRGSECPILHAKQDQPYPIGFNDGRARRTGPTVSYWSVMAGRAIGTFPASQTLIPMSATLQPDSARALDLKP
jgi:hypothetical protein